MRTLKSLGVFVGIALLAAGCAPIYFHNGGDAEGMDDERLHSIGIFGLVEFSDPQDLADLCRGSEWETAMTKLSGTAILLRQLASPFWTPWGFGHRCRR
jgi:hypothetical protein